MAHVTVGDSMAHVTVEGYMAHVTIYAMEVRIRDC